MIENSKELIRIKKIAKGKEFEKEAEECLKDIFDNVYHINSPTDFLALNNNGKIFLIEVKHSYGTYLHCSELQIKYATHFLFKNKNGIFFMKKKKFFNKFSFNLTYITIDEKIYIQRFCKKYIKIMDNIQK